MGTHISKVMGGEAMDVSVDACVRVGVGFLFVELSLCFQFSQ